MPTIPLVLDANTKRAVKDMRKFGKSASKSVKGVERSFTALKAVAAGAVGFLAGRALINGIKSVTEAASIQEDAINNLNTALKVSGEFSLEASQDMQDFASEIQGTTKFGDELILSQLSLAKAFGATNEQAKIVTEASVELASATGKSLQDATQQVSKTLGGFAGELGEVNPAIKALTAEQLKAGEAAKILIDQYGGTAAAQVNTFSGALTQLTNTQGDLNEEIGFTITESAGVVGALKGLTAGYGVLIDFVKENREGLQEFIDKGIRALVKSIPKAVKALGAISKTFSNIKFAVAAALEAVADFFLLALKSDKVADSVRFIADQFTVIAAATELAIEGAKLFGGATKESVREALKNYREFKSEIADTGVNIEALRNDIKAFGSDMTVAADEASASITELDNIFEGAVELAKDFGDEIINGMDAAKASADESTGAIVDQTSALSDLKAAAEEAGDAFLKIAFPERDLKKALGQIIGGALSDGAATAKGLAVKALAGVGEAAGTAFGVPGIGGFLEPILAAAAQGPAAAKEQAKLFAEGIAESIPTIITALIEALPVLIDELIRVLIDEGGIVKIADALIIAMPRIAVALTAGLLRGIGTVGEHLAYGFTKNITRPFREFLDTLRGFEFPSIPVPDWLNDFAIETPGWITSLIDAINRLINAFEVPDVSAGDINAAGGILGAVVGGVIAGPVGAVIGGVTGGTSGGGSVSVGGTTLASWQEGGIVPPGFPDDSFRANLTSGEAVLRPRTAANLQDAIDNMAQGGSGSANVEALLAQLVGLMSQPMTAVATAEVNETAFADIILNLDRQNARTAA